MHYLFIYLYLLFIPFISGMDSEKGILNQSQAISSKHPLWLF